MKGKKHNEYYYEKYGKKIVQMNRKGEWIEQESDNIYPRYLSNSILVLSKCVEENPLKYL